MNLESWFPTPVIYDFANEELKNAIKQEFFKSEKEIVTKIQNMVWGDNVASTFNTTKNILDEYQLSNLKNYILFVANEFNKNLYPNKNIITINNCWVNYNIKHQYQNKHNHLPYDISGVYYIQTNGKDGDLIFSNLNPNTHILKNTSVFTCSEVSYAPEEGKIIMFPSWVEHSVRANMTDSTRISVSFNLKVE